MYIEKLKVKNFRNIENLQICLNKNINIFIGNNAQGKTSILESIYVLSLTKSSKNLDDEELINKNSDFSIISGLTRIGNTKKKMDIVLQKNSKTIKINDQIENKISNYISNLNVIMFSPDDLDIIKKSPVIRRNLLNIELCQLFKNYTRILNEYNKLLKIRNEYLKKNYNQINRDYLDIITDKLIDRMLIIMEYRQKYIDSININISNIYNKIMKTGELKVVYNKNINLGDKNSIKKLYFDNFSNEVNKKVTLFGSHRDDIDFYIDDDDVKNYGSQGQQRVAILAFKLAEINLFKEVTGTYPVVLLDDIFSELDIEKRNNLIKFIKSNIQFIITTTDIKNISNKILDKASVYKIKNGNITR